MIMELIMQLMQWAILSFHSNFIAFESTHRHGIAVLCSSSIFCYYLWGFCGGHTQSWLDGYRAGEFEARNLECKAWAPDHWVVSWSGSYSLTVLRMFILYATVAVDILTHSEYPLLLVSLVLLFPFK